MARKKKDYNYDGIMRLVGGILLLILDHISISGKWYPRKLSMKVLQEKRAKLEEMRLWFKTPAWSIWLNLYCDYHGRNERTIRKNFEQIRRQSVKYVNKRIKALQAEPQNPEPSTELSTGC